MPSSSRQNTVPNHRFWWPRLLGFAALILLLLGGWFYAWNWGSRQLEQRVESTLARFDENGLFLDCAGKRIVGFPFRLGLFCDSVYAKQSATGSIVSTGEFRSAAQFYAPGRIVAELDGPAKYEPFGSLPYIIEWSLMRASVSASLEGPRAVSVDGDNIRLLDGWAPQAPAIASASDLQVHARLAPDEADDLELAIAGDDVRIAGEYLPELAITGDLRFEGIVPYLTPGFELGRHVRANGLSGTARKISVAPATGGRIEMNGPFSIDRNGRFSGEIRLGAARFDQLMPFLEKLIPGQTEAFLIAGNLLNGLGTKEGDLRYVTLSVERGEISIGIVVLGTMPALF